MDIAQLRTALASTSDPACQAVALLLDAIVEKPDRARALIDLADSQLLLEDDFAREQAPRSYPVPDGETLLWLIQCDARRQAKRRDEGLPECKWKRDACGYTCQRCAKWEGEETPRGEFIARSFAHAERGSKD